MHRPAGAQVTSGLSTQLPVQSCMEGRQAATACCLVVLRGSGLEQKDQYPPFPDEETEAWRGLALAHVTWPWEIGRAELGGCLGVGMCVVAGPRPGRGGRRLLPGGEADSGGEPGWGRLLLLQAEAGRRHRLRRHQMLQSPSLQHAASAPRHPTPWGLWADPLWASESLGHKTRWAIGRGHGASQGFGLHWVTP